MKKIILLILFLASQIAIAQEQETDVCVQNIEIAQQRFDEGRIQDIQSLLLDCLERGGFNSAQKSQALRLLTLSYIFLEDVDKAEANMLSLLEEDHEFKVNPAIDPTEFINLHEQFRYKPLFNLGGRYIFNFAQPIVTDLNSSLSQTVEVPVYTIQFGTLGIGLNFEYEFFKNLILYPEIHFKNMAILRTEHQKGSATGEEYITIENHEDQQWVSMPISVKYNLVFPNIPKLKLYANLGGSIDFLLNAKKPSDKAVRTTPNDPEVGFNLTTTSDKNRLNFGLIAGGGVAFKIGEGFVSLEGRYLHSLTKVTKPENILQPSDPAQNNTGIQDDIYRLNHIAISIGYTLNIYMPKQLR